MAKRALIYGISGQDGHYLSQLLSEKGYMVAGVSRNGACPSPAAKCYAADLSGESNGYLFPIDDFSPDEIYNLAGISSPLAANSKPELAFRVNSQPAMEILQKISDESLKARFFQASSCYMFSGSQKINEQTPPSPSGAYGLSKFQAHAAVAEYRERAVYACSGILFNHESPLRPPGFVTRKISSAVAAFSLGIRKEPLQLGDLGARRDWGFAGDYVGAMWLMLQQPSPDDYVIATGETHSVRDFCEAAFAHAGLDYKKYVTIDRTHIRPSEVDMLCGNSKKAREKLGWKPKVDFPSLVRMMVDADMEHVKRSGKC